MHTLFAKLRLPAISGLLLLLPFMLLELVNRRGLDEAFPFPLFAFMWLLPAVFSVMLPPIVRDVRNWNPATSLRVGLLTRLALLALLAWLWVAMLIDQMPCFLGVPTCD